MLTFNVNVIQFCQKKDWFVKLLENFALFSVYTSVVEEVVKDFTNKFLKS